MQPEDENRPGELLRLELGLFDPHTATLDGGNQGYGWEQMFGSLVGVTLLTHWTWPFLNWKGYERFWLKLVDLCQGMKLFLVLWG